MKYEPTIILFTGALETSTIHVVPKNKAHDSVVKKLPTKMPNQPFEATFRLQVRPNQTTLESTLEIQLQKNDNPICHRKCQPNMPPN